MTVNLSRGISTSMFLQVVLAGVVDLDRLRGSRRRAMPAALHSGGSRVAA